jgi:dipeptidyl aminopeptidase/acylaminoacyl peptidase
MKRALIILVGFLVALPAFAEKRAFTIEDVYRTKSVSDMSVSPDGNRVVFTVTSSDLPRAKRSSRIWIADTNGNTVRELTQGDSDSSAKWSPDGRSIAFVRTKDSQSNLWLLPLAGGESRQMTNISTGVSDPIWAPNGKSIAFASDVYPECGADDACNKRVNERWSKGKLQAHLANGLLYRHWTAWRDGQATHLLLANASDGTVRDLTPGAFDYPTFQLGGPTQYDFSPDSNEIVVVSNHDAHPESSTNNDLFLISLAAPNAQPRDVTASNPAFDGSPKYSPDGRYIAYRMQKQPGYESDLFRLAVYDRQAGTSRVLTEQYRNWIDDFDWSEDSKAIYFAGPFEGINPIRRVDVASGAITNVYSDRTVDGFRISRDGRTIVYIGRGINEPTEMYRADIAAGSVARRRVTHVNDAFVNEVDVRPAEVSWITGAGGARIQTFIVKPHDFDPSKKYPLILNVHGGPQDMWSDAYRGDWQVYPGAGYVVAFSNPHGSTGYGQDFTSEISGDWGGMPFQDLMMVTDSLEKLPYVDTSRIGAMGWSFGGYMMDWFEGHTTRFKAIASMMGVYDLRAMYSATEELWFPAWDLKGLPWSSDLYAKFSPSNFVTNFKTPCLVISGERDYRVPYTQSLEFYTDLQKMGVPSRLIIYSEAGHWPSWYEMALYYTAHVEWFHQYLGGAAPPWSTEAFLRNAVFDTSTGKRIEEPPPLSPQEKPLANVKPPENPHGKPDVKPHGM